jgi:histidine decarboxylase
MHGALAKAPFFDRHGLSLDSSDDKILNAFQESRSQWIDDPVICQWRNPDHPIKHVLSEANKLYYKWKYAPCTPFSSSPNPLWQDTGRLMADAGLPWHANQVNMPDEIDTSWEFHFKGFELQLLSLMGSRVGDPNPSGYVCTYTEANCYCIRALQQELKKSCPTQKPVLVYDQFDSQLIVCFEKFFGLEIHRVCLSHPVENLEESLLAATSQGARPIIFAATVGNSAMNYDDLIVISKLSQKFSLLLHIDAFRNFDYITSTGDTERRLLGGERIRLGAKLLSEPLRTHDGFVLATSIVAGGLVESRSAPAVALKPSSLITKATRVPYIRSFDSTLGGSRDAIGPLWLALYEMRLGENGLRDICRHLTKMRTGVLRLLQSQGISASASPYCSDVVVQSCSLAQKRKLQEMGGFVTDSGKIVLNIHPHLKLDQLHLICASRSVSYSDTRPNYPASFMDLVKSYPMPENILSELQDTVQSWKVMTRSMAGYPLHMGSLSVLGPIVGQFLDVNIPQDWADNMSQQLLTSRFEYFGLSEARDRKLFRGAFTNGSTMGNRLGIHTALAQFPNAFVYLSTETHYSVMKILRDCDKLAGNQTKGTPRYSVIPCYRDGSMCIEKLVHQALSDKKYCFESGQDYHMILFANMGTTFVGAKDDIMGISMSLRQNGIRISYIHVDGAFSFGFDSCGIKLGPPKATDANGMPLVQGVTISHHKALGQNVSGEVLCFSPDNSFPTLSSHNDPRVIFETWLFSQIYQPNDLALLLAHCRKNASYLEEKLKRQKMATKRNAESIIVVFERPPAWTVEEFSLRPEGDWVHLITVPHISRDIIDLFVHRISSIDLECSVAFGCVTPLLSDLASRQLELKRIRCRSALAERVSRLACSSPHFSSVYGEESWTTVESSLRGALSIVAVDKNDDVKLIFLLRSHRNKSIRVGPVLVEARASFDERKLLDIARQLMGLLGRFLGAELKIDNSSYGIYKF